jgi:FkbH-like protein
MLDRPDPPVPLLSEIQRSLSQRTPSLAEIFETGERLAAAAPGEGTEVPVQRIAVLGALTTDFLSHAIACAVAQEGVFPILYQAPFGAYVQEVLDPSAGLHAFKPDIVVIAPDWHDLVDSLPPDTPGEAVQTAVAEKVDMFRLLWDRLSGGLGCRILQHTLALPTRRYCGVAERLMEASIGNQVRMLNDRLLRAGRGLVGWVDIEALANDIGTRSFAPARFFHNAKLPFENRHLPAYLPAFRGAWRAACGRTKKVLALDLDNTLWGGVIGDDGVEGISVGPGSPAGEAFAEWQHYIKDLRARGIVLAACSKNDPAIAASGFTHANTVLGCSDFAAFECSWNDKVQGLRRIARDLNLGLDSIVFCDDNPAECELVRQELPEVAVVHLAGGPARFIELLDAGHWFDQEQYTTEDLGRGDMYAARARAQEEQQSAPDIASYLKGLNMVGRLYRPEEADIARVAQLEMKTNQFNLTTRRYSEPALRDFLARPDAIVLAFRLADRFADHGLTSTLIAVQQGDTLRIDSWLMSCRIFSRSAEHAIMRGLLRMARARGVRRVLGEYRPTAKNGVVADLYARLGFGACADPAFRERAIDTAAPDGSGFADLVTAIAEV